MKASVVTLLPMVGSIAVAAMPVSAQTVDDAIEEIMVTAQRRVTDLQTTAAAISAYSADDLARKSIEDVEDLGILNPSMHVALYQGEAQVYIRGIGYSGIIGGSDSSTALHQDGVYLSRSAAAVPAFFDVDRVEVVRGPQGTLYGRNATGGSVNLITRGASRKPGSEFSFLVGDYGRYRGFGAVSGPIGDSAAFRLAGQIEKQDGFTTLSRPVVDPLSGEPVTTDVEDTDEMMARATLELDVSGTMSVTLKGDYYEADDSNSVWLYFNPGTSTNPFLRQYLADRGGTLPENPKSRSQESDLPHLNKPKIWGLSAKIDWALGDYALTSLTAFKHTNPLNRNDLDATAAFGVDQLREEDHDQVSQEFQLSSPENGRFNWILGLYYFREENDVRNEYFLPFVDEQFGLPSDDQCCLLQLNGSAETEAYAAFGEGIWQLTDTIDIVLGMRYSDETRDGENAVRLVEFPTPVLDNIAELEQASFDDFTPKVGLNLALGDRTFVYGTVSEGFKSGGFNIGSYQNTPFDPEKLTAWELGLKSDLLEQRLRMNAAAFYYDYQDYQFQDVENNNTVIRNAAEAELLGLEVEGTALVGSRLLADFAVTWLSAEFTNFTATDPKAPQLGVQDLDGRRLPRAPRLKYALGLQYTVPAGPGEIEIRTDYAWQDEVWFSAFNVPELYQDSYGWLKARMAYSSADGTWRISGVIDNVLDEKVISNATFTGDIIDSIVTGNMAPPRTYGVELSYRFGANQ